MRPYVQFTWQFWAQLALKMQTTFKESIKTKLAKNKMEQTRNKKRAKLSQAQPILDTLQRQRQHSKDKLNRAEDDVGLGSQSSCRNF